jgi:hypothetical protein
MKETMTGSEEWDVLVGQPNDPGRPDGGGTAETVVYEGDEAGAKAAFDREVTKAARLGYRYVHLRRNKEVVQRWP